MTQESSTLAGLLMVVVIGLVVMFGALLVARLARSGGFERSLAALLVHRTHRLAFLWQLTLALVAFVAVGIVSVLNNLGLISDLISDVLTAFIYAAGGIAILLIVAGGLRVADLTLSNELDLRDSHPMVLGAIPAARRRTSESELTSYFAYPIEDRAKISNGSSEDFPEAWS